MYAKDTLALMEGLRARLSYPVYAEYLKYFLLSNRLDFRSPADDPRHDGERFAAQMRVTLEHATPYLLADEMLPVVSFAAKGLEGTMQITHDLWPSDHGFLVFEKGMPVTERRGKQMVSKALLWWRHSAQDPDSGKRYAGTVVVGFSDMEDPRDEISAQLREEETAEGNPFATALGRLQVDHIQFIPDGMRIGPEEITSTITDEYGQPVKAHNGGRFLASFFLMLRQTITSSKVEAVSPRQAKHLAKRRLPTQVTVVQMRRIVGIHREPGESKIEWANRWLVTGHWRNQPVGPTYPGAVEAEPGRFVARIWIAPFVKGPEDAPFKPQSRKIIALTR